MALTGSPSASRPQNVRDARWGEAVSDEEIAAAEQQLGLRLPPDWRDFLQGGPWLREGWLASGQFLQCYGPTEASELIAAWDPGAARHPGIYLLGGDGSRDLYCVDLRDAKPAVQLTDITSSGWHDAEPLLPSVSQFVDAIRDGSLRAYPQQ
ncbi:hypothetical protein BA895_11195 [Humibacillus sp. DSM 29435]|nr:hypothetical protein BA895_11195 [Humibacillus sp. DSM 29435]